MINHLKNEKPSKRFGNHFHSVFSRLILIFLLVLTPIVVIGLIIIQSGYSMLDDEITHSLTSQVDFKMREMEIQLTSMQNQVSQIMEVREMLWLSGMPDMLNSYDQLSELNGLQERLRMIRDGSLFVEQLELYLPKLNRKIAAVGSQRESTILKYDPSELDALLDVCMNHFNRVAYINKQLLYIEQMPIALAMGAERIPRIVMKVTLNTNGINQFFSGMLSDQTSHHVFLFGDGTRFPEVEDGVVDWAVQNRETAWEAETVRMDGKEYYVVRRSSKILDAVCLVYVERDHVFNAIYIFQRFFLLMAAFVGVGVVIYCIYAYVSVHTPLHLLATAFNRLAEGEMDFQIEYKKKNEFFFLTSRFNRMLSQLKSTLNQLYEERILMQQAQLKQLQAQINPHFLYNSFFALDNMIVMEDTDNASEFCRRLGQYFRYVTRDNRDMVPLHEEVEHAQSYVEIQRIRFGQRLSIDFQAVPDWAQHIETSRLILQPIIENAFVHSLEKCISGGILIIRFIPNGDGLIIEVENNGIADAEAVAASLNASLKDASAPQEVTGLINVHRRLMLTHKAGLMCRAVPPDGLVVTLHLKRIS